MQIGVSKHGFCCHMNLSTLAGFLTCVVCVTLLLQMTSVHRQRTFRTVDGGLSRVHSDYSGASSQSITPTIYMITPTKKRTEQKADLTRLSYTLMLVPNLHWIVVEDSESRSPMIGRLLRRSGLSFTHLNLLTPKDAKGRGMEQRNAGLSHLRAVFSEAKNVSGVVYFGDDDNTYDIRLFEKMRWIKKVGVWAVAFVGQIILEKPLVKLVNNSQKVVDWDVGYLRKFSSDMAGFAVNLHIILEKKDALFRGHGCGSGYFETCFLNKLGVKMSELEPIGFENLTDSSINLKKNPVWEVLVWHTKTQKYRTGSEGKFIEKHQNRSSVDGWEV